MPQSIGVAARLALTFLLLFSALDVAARPKTDIVVLENGDRVTGEIKSMQYGRLQYGTSSMGTVSIEWNDVITLDSNHFFRLRTEGQQRYFGALGESLMPGHVKIVHAGGVEDISVMDIVEITPIENTLEDRLDSVLNVGYSDIKANEARTTNVGLRMKYRDEYSENELEARSVVAESETETNTNNRVNLSRRQLWQNPLYFNYYRLGWERNDQLAIDSRLVATYGIGRRFFDSNSTKLAVTTGFQLVNEEDSQGESTDSVEGLLAVDYRTWSFSDPDLNLVTGVRLYPGITETGRLRADGDITLSWDIIGDLSLSLTAFGSFDNETNDDGDDYDYGITTGVAWDF